MQLNRKSSGFDAFLRGEEMNDSIPELDDTRNGFPVGSRVAFHATMQSLLTYPNSPNHGTVGYVVRVHDRIASTLPGNVWVKWDDGSFGMFQTKHVSRVASHRSRKAFNISFSTESLEELSDEYMIHTASTLVHKAKKDLWSFRKGEDGKYVIERLFDDSGEPVKV